NVRFILTFIAIMFVLDALWLAVSMRIARPLVARISVGIFSLAQLAGLIWLVTQRFSHPGSAALFPKFAIIVVFIWHMILLPLLLLLAVVSLPVLGAVV